MNASSLYRQYIYVTMTSKTVHGGGSDLTPPPPPTHTHNQKPSNLLLFGVYARITYNLCDPPPPPPKRTICLPSNASLSCEILSAAQVASPIVSKCLHRSGTTILLLKMVSLHTQPHNYWLNSSRSCSTSAHSHSEHCFPAPSSKGRMS